MLSTDTMTRSILALSIIAILGGCSTLPRDGPSNRAVVRGAVENADYAIVDLDYAAAERIKAVGSGAYSSLAGAASLAPVDVIGEGDQLAVSIFEPSGSLFGGGASSSNIRSGNQSLPPVTVDRSGSVTVPFAGAVRVAGMTTTEAQAAIRRALIGRVGNPQVSVTIATNVSNAVTVLGEVRQPGRAALSTNADTILDVIAARGGASRPNQDVEVQIRRGDQAFTAPLTAVTTRFEENIRLQSGDQINLVYQPRRFSSFGALSAVTQQDMPAGEFTLADALSRSGGLNDSAANARSVLIFRFERPEVAQALGVTQAPTPQGVPIVYRLNLEEGAGFFTASSFLVQPRDIIYAPRALSAEIGKFFGLVQQVTRVAYDVTVASTLNTD